MIEERFLFVKMVYIIYVENLLKNNEIIILVKLLNEIVLGKI